MYGPLIALGVAFGAFLFAGPSPRGAPKPDKDLPPLVVTRATWGGDCGAPEGNATDWVRDTCGDARACRLVVDREQLGDPTPGCDKTLEVVLGCGPGDRERLARGEDGERLVLSCGDVIDVRAATYGDNCGAPEGNATEHLAEACAGKRRCRYVVDFEALGDPAPGCPKRYSARWRCTAGGDAQRIELPAEAGAKRPIELRCPKAEPDERLTIR